MNEHSVKGIVLFPSVPSNATKRQLVTFLKEKAYIRRWKLLYIFKASE